jgi:ATP-dependent helicase/nuclease subunit B
MNAARIRFLLGPAGAGKTSRSLSEIRAELSASAEGPPLLFLAPRQATFQLERQLLETGEIAGYTRLHILSFERLAHFVLQRLGWPAPRMLDEEGRLMVLRALLARRPDGLRLFRANARLAGFAREWSLLLREFQRHRLTPESLSQTSADLGGASGLALKLQDFAVLYRDYLDWLKSHDLQDADCLIAAAARALASAQAQDKPRSHVAALWVDGFGDFSPQELELLAAVVAHSDRATFAFCLDRAPEERASWLSHWSWLWRTFEQCKRRIGAIPGAQGSVELLPRDSHKSRFSGAPLLLHLERHWDQAKPRVAGPGPLPVRIVHCANPEAEAALAARGILRHVRAGGRFRDAAVIVRDLEGYHGVLQRVFARYGIPFFLDRRETVSHHPLAELTRSALRMAAFQWTHEDCFAALKTGLAPATDEEIDLLENQALAHGWKAGDWLRPLHVSEDAPLAARLEQVRRRVVPPFENLVLGLGVPQDRLSGVELAACLRSFWEALDVKARLTEWTDARAEANLHIPSAVHETVWDQMNAWLDNVELAFHEDRLPLREWLPIIEAGLTHLAVGVIPPSLDQVLIGAVDRSRNPDLKLVFVLGMNEGVFPAPPRSGSLLTESDRAELGECGTPIGLSQRQQLSRERFYAYIACTRPRERLVLTAAREDTGGRKLNPSPFLSHMQRLFPSLHVEQEPPSPSLRDTEHPTEIVAPIIEAATAAGSGRSPATVRRVLDELLTVPDLRAVADRLRHIDSGQAVERISPALAAQLYGPVLQTSVSRIEQFAACPFRFFVHSGLRAEERKQYELDAREQGSFQHEALKLFHEHLRKDRKRWRDLTPAEARELIGQIAAALAATYRDGLLRADDQARFTARVLTESLQDFAATLVEWMRNQYTFEPSAVELPFGEEAGAPPWELELGDGHKLAMRGRIDRVDLCAAESGEAAWCVVVDYKSSPKQLETVRIANGLQLQLLSYLNTLRQWPDPLGSFGVERLLPAGVFYVNLRGKYEPAPNRLEGLDAPEAVRRLAYRHAGRFDKTILPRLDARLDATTGDQFNYRRNKDGGISALSRDAMAPAEFARLLDTARDALGIMGRRIYDGEAAVDPYRRGAETACDQCEFQAVCRVDAQTHHYRQLKAVKDEE